ncbi:zinc finger protein 318-like isoform X2 [Sphaerodactylus townsendi]|uniref:zinc finger protein 318-like isoform X2 n=1 Tax=Sphaerodactylus townsendi TaxID=933632 RepID=UPI002026EEED|nr:zinc finger protein 318-like isoform X2 [Sphaerodactylus townsendi]
MYRSASGRSSLSSSSRSKESSSSGSRSSRSGASTSGSTRGRSPRRSRSPSPRGRRSRRRSPSSSRSARRSPSPRRTSRARSPSLGRRSRRGSEQRDCSLSRRRSPGRRSRSPGRRSHSPGRRSPSRHSESSVEHSLRITVGNDHYGADTPERRRLSDRLGSPVDSLSDVERDDLAEGPIFSRGLLRPQSLERYSSREDSPPSPFNARQDEDYRSRDIFLHQSDYSMNYDHLQDISREHNRDSEVLRKSLCQSEERGREPKRPRYDREDKLFAGNMEHQGFLAGTRNYRKRSLSRSPSPRPAYLDEDFRELQSARRKREEEELNRKSSHDLPGSGCVIPGLTNPVQSSEPRYLYRPDEAPTMPKKSILKKRVDDSSVQPEVFSGSSASVKELPLHSQTPPLPQRSNITPFSSEVENFLKRFNKNAVAESANKDSQANANDWRPFSGLQQNTFPSEQNAGSFLRQKDHQESTAGSADRQGDFLLPHERASQDGSGFSRILGMMADSTSAQEKRRRSFPDIEDEEKFLYGDDDDDSNINSPTENITMSGKEPVSQKLSSPSSPTQSVKLDTSEESRPEYEKIHDLLKTIGLDIGVAEIGKLAARTQERLHGKKTSRSPDRHLAVSHKPDSREMRRSRSNTHSPESNQKCSLSPSGSFPSPKELSSMSELERSKCKTEGHNNSSGTPERSVPPVSLIPSAPPALPNLPPAPTPMSQYAVPRFPPFTAAQLPQNYPTPTMAPPSYDAYGHYMAYAASGWPMYAPPQQSDPAIPDVRGLVSLTVPPNPTRPNLRVIETVSTGKGAPEIKRDESVLVQIPTTSTYSTFPPHLSQSALKGPMERMSDEKNRASQKQKVIEEREKLKVEQEARQKKLHYLRTELDRLSKQQGEMLRKKRREKDGHKDPLLVEVNRLQENIMKEIAQLQIQTESAEKKQSELDKVAQILGINIFEKSRKPSAESKDSTEKNKSENSRSQEKISSSNKESKPPNDKPRGRSPKPTESCLQPSKQQLQLGNIYDYYDTGNHWCKDCNTFCGTMFDFFTHMHNKKHRQTLDPYNRPWASKTQTETKQDPMKHIDKIALPAKGSEFLIPVTGYYCQLCHEFFGDQISAEQHVKSHPHNEKYKKYVDENPLYEERRNLDRQAGLAVIQETERRLKRKQCEKQKEDRDGKNAKVAKKEESNPAKELGEESSKNEISKRKEDSDGQKFGIKLKLKKDNKEVEKKESKKEESQKDSKQSSFGKFSWRKTEKEDKNHDKDAASPREECVEEGKDKESKSQSGKSSTKPIAIKLSGKTVIPHTSPWTPVVTTSSQAKIRPNLPVPVMVLRKSATTSVSKPAPLNTFLSIKSSGATTKPLPVVKESNPELVLPPDIISKAFGGEVVVLKGSQENVKIPERAETQVQETESVMKTVEQTKAQEHVKASMEKVQEQAMLVAKAQAKARELAVLAKEQEAARVPKMHEEPHFFERPRRRPPLLPLPPRPPLSLLPPQPSPLVFPRPRPPNQTPLILADDMAPGVSEDDKNILAMPMCPRPLPPPAIFKDHIKKMEKKNTCLAAGNAKDLYDIFYNNSGRTPADKPASSVVLDKGKLSPVDKEGSTGTLADSKPDVPSSVQVTLQNVESVLNTNIISVSEESPGTEVVKAEKVSAASEENFVIATRVEEESQTIPLSDLQNTAKHMETAKSNDIPLSASVSLQNEIEIGITASSELNNKSSELGRVELTVQTLNSSCLPSDEVCKKPSESEIAESVIQLSEENVLLLQDIDKKSTQFETSEFILLSENTPPPEEGNKNISELQTAVFIPPDNELATSSEDKALSLLEVNKKPVDLVTAQFTMNFPEGCMPPLQEEVNKNSSEVQTAMIMPSENKATTPLSEDKTLSLQDVNKKPVHLETSEFTTILPISNTPLLEEVSRNSSGLQTVASISSDNELDTVSEDKALSLQDVSEKSVNLETVQFTMDFPESSTPLQEEVSKNSSEVQTAVFLSFDNAATTPLSEDKDFILQDMCKKPIEFETATLAVTLPEISTPPLEVISKNASELQTEEFKFSDGKELITQLPEDSVLPLEHVNKKPSEFEKTELAITLPGSNGTPLEEVCKNTLQLETIALKTLDNELATPLAENETDYSKETPAMIDVGVTNDRDVGQKPQEHQKTEVRFESDVEMETDVAILVEGDVERKHIELAACQSEINQEYLESQVLKMQVETHKEKEPVPTEEKPISDSSELIVSPWVSDMCIHSHLTWEPIDTSSKVNEENPQVAETGQGSSEVSTVDFNLGTVGFDRLESAFIAESPPVSVAQNMNPELKTCHKGESDSFHTNSKEEGLLANYQQKADEDFDVVHVPESGELPVECLVKVTMTSCTQEEHEINQQSLSSETKNLQVQETVDLGSISSNDVELSSGVELIFVKGGTQGLSKSTVELTEERDSIEKENFSRVQPTSVQETLDVLPTEFSVGHLGEEALSFTSLNTEVLNTSATGDLDLHTTYSEFSFDQSATLTLNLNVENERDSPKTSEIKPTDLSRPKPCLELEAIDFSLGDIDVDREHLDILPSEILNEDSVVTPKLEIMAPICLESSRTIELGISQPGVEPEVIDFAALTSGDQDEKVHSLVSDIADPHMVSPAPSDGTAETEMPLFKMQCRPPISEALLKTDSKGSTSDILSLSCGDKSLPSQAAECTEPHFPNPKETCLEVGGSGDSEFYVVKNDIQTHTKELTKTEEVESNDGVCEVNSKLASEGTESPAENLLL